MQKNIYLISAAMCCFAAAAAHIAIVIGGPDWYRFFGAGEEMAQMAARGEAYPVVVTLIIAVVLSVWGFYALSGTGLVRRLPLLKLALIMISFIFCTRGLVGLLMPVLSRDPYVIATGTTFWIISSGICLVIGALYILGIRKNWAQINR